MADLCSESAPGTPDTVAGFSTQRQAQVWQLLASALSQVSTAGRAPTVLDCGGGTGALSVPLARAGAQVCAFDISVDALAILSRRAAEAGVSDRINAVQADLEALTPNDLGTVPAIGFDLIVAHSVLQELSAGVVPAAIKRLAGLLRPGGMISVVLANPVASVLGRALGGEVEAALQELRVLGAQAGLTAQVTGALPGSSTESATARVGVDALRQACTAAGLEIVSVCGVGVFTELVPGLLPGSELDVSPHRSEAVAELERIGSLLPPFRDIASQVALLARRPGDSPD